MHDLLHIENVSVSIEDDTVLNSISFGLKRGNVGYLPRSSGNDKKSGGMLSTQVSLVAIGAGQVTSSPLQPNNLMLKIMLE